MKIKNPFHRNSKDASTSSTAGDTAPHPVSTSSTSTTSTTNAPNTISNTASNLSSNLGPTTSTTSAASSSSSGTGLAPTTYSSALNPPMSSTSDTSTGGGQQAPGSSNLATTPSHTQTGFSSFGAGQNMMMPAGQGQGQGFQTMTQQPVATTIIQRPAVVHEEVREVERQIIQPVISRQREQTEIHQITQPFNEREVRPTLVEERVLQPEYRPTQQPREMPVQQQPLQSTREVAPKVTQVFQEQAVIEETVHKTIREEIQPVIYKETLVPTVVQQVKPIFEKIVEAPVILHMQRAPIILKEGETYQNMLGQQQLGQQSRFMGQGGQGGGFVGQPPSSSWDVKPPLGAGVTNTTTPTTTTSNVNAPLSSTSSAIPASTSNVNPAAPRQNLV